MPELVSVITAWDEKCAALGEYIWPNRVGYCYQHGYGLQGGLTDAASGFWVKATTILDSLESGDGWAAWFDADVLITDQSSPMHWLDTTPADLIYSADTNGLNAGVLFVRNTGWSRQLVRRWLDSRSFYERYPNGDQAALAHLLLAEPKDRWECLPQRTFNSYIYSEYGLYYPDGEWSCGDFALHLPGLSDSRRMEIFKKIDF